MTKCLKSILKGSAIATLLCWSGGALGSDARTLILNLPAGLTDTSYVFAYPSLAAGKSLVGIELGQPTSDVYGGGLYSTKVGTFGLFVSRDASLMQTRASVVTDSPDVAMLVARTYMFSRKALSSLAPSPARPLDFIYAMELSGGAGLGLRLTWAGDHTREKTAAQTQENTSDQLDLQLALSTKTAGSKIDVAAKIGILGTIENETKANNQTTSTTYSRGISLGFNARAVRPVSSQTDAYLKAGFFYENPELEQKAADTTRDKNLSELVFDLQLGALVRPRPETLVTFGGAFLYFASEGPFSLDPAANQTIPQSLQQGTETLGVDLTRGTSELSGYGLLATAGVENKLTDHWILLAGIGYPLLGAMEAKDKVKDGNPSYEFRFADIPEAELWQFGVGYERNGFRADAGVSAKSLLHNGPQFITGNTTASPVLFVISAEYNFSQGSSAATPPPAAPTPVPPAPPGA